MPDTSNAKKPEMKPIEKDWYEVKFTDFKEKIDKNGDLYLEVQFDFEDSNRKAWNNLSYNSEYLYGLKQFKKAIGAVDSEDNLTQYKGTRLEIFCKNRVYKESNQTEVVDYRPFGSGDTTPQAPKDEDDLSWMEK